MQRSKLKFSKKPGLGREHGGGKGSTAGERTDEEWSAEWTCLPGKCGSSEVRRMDGCLMTYAPGLLKC